MLAGRSATAATLAPVETSGAMTVSVGKVASVRGPCFNASKMQSRIIHMHAAT